RHNSRVALSSSTIRIEKPVALVLGFSGFGPTSTATLLSKRARLVPKRPRGVLITGRFAEGKSERARAMYTEKGIMSINTSAIWQQVMEIPMVTKTEGAADRFGKMLQ